jgi:hypothetical protein
MARGLGGTHVRGGVLLGLDLGERWSGGLGQTPNRVGGPMKYRGA